MTQHYLSKAIPKRISYYIVSLKELKTLTTCASHLMRRNNESKNLNSLTIVLLILALYCISFGKEISWSVINGMNVIPLWICYVS